MNAKAGPADGSFDLEVQISGLVFFAVVRNVKNDGKEYDGLYGLLVSANHLHLNDRQGNHSNHSEDDEHAPWLFVDQKYGANTGGEDDSPYRRYSLRGVELRWPGVVAVPRYQLPIGVTNLSQVTGYDFDVEQLRIGSNVSAIIDLNLGDLHPVWSNGTFKFVTDADARYSTEVVPLTWKFMMTTRLKGDDLDLRIPQLPKLKPDPQQKKIQLIVKNVTSDFAHGADIEKDYDPKRARHFMAHYNLLDPEKTYPVLDQATEMQMRVGGQYTCMPGGGTGGGG